MNYIQLQNHINNSLIITNKKRNKTKKKTIRDEKKTNKIKQENAHAINENFLTSKSGKIILKK